MVIVVFQAIVHFAAALLADKTFDQLLVFALSKRAQDTENKLDDAGVAAVAAALGVTKQ